MQQQQATTAASRSNLATGRESGLGPGAGMLGHASVNTIQVYASIVDELPDNPARYLEAVMGA